MSTDAPTANNPDEQDASDRIRVHVPPDLDYVYRDVTTIYVGAGEVTIEFGNYHRSMPGHVSIGNRIVLSIANAYDLQQRLSQSLQEAQKRLQDELKQKSNR